MVAAPREKLEPRKQAQRLVSGLGADDANCLLCVEYTNTMTGVRSWNGLNGSVGASRCSSESSIKECALSARASGRRGAVWELGEAYLRPRARRSIAKRRSKVISCESARSTYRKALLVLWTKRWVLVEAAGPKHCRRGLGRTRKRRAARRR